MDITIKENKENKALFRNEVVAEMFFEKSTPNRKEIQKAVAKSLKVDETLVIIKQIKTEFGKSKAKITAHIYSNKDIMNKLERKNLIAKHVGAEKAKEETKEEGE